MAEPELHPNTEPQPDDVAGAAAGAAHQLLAGGTAEGLPTIWPPVEPESPDSLLLSQPSPAPVGQQFPGLDPELLSQSVEVTAPAPASPVPTLGHRMRALRRDWLATRYPLVVVAVFLAAISLPRTIESVVSVTSAYPVVGTLALVLWALYAFPLIWLITRFDFFEREPVAVIAMGLAWGGVIATSMAVAANQAVFSLLTSAFGEAFTQRWGAALAAPTTEESLKAIGILAVLLLAQRRIRSATDGFVVGAMVGLGFQVVENFVYTGNLLLATGVEDKPLTAVLNVFIVRGIGSGLWSHAAYSGVAGLGIGYAFTRPDRTPVRRLFIVAAALGMAWFMHFLWNLPVLLDSAAAAGVVAKALIILAMLLVVVMRNQGRESYIYTDYLESVHDPAVITLGEIEDLRTYRTREAAARTAARSGGEKAADAVRALQRAQADLSVALATGDLERVAAARRDIAAARNRMATAALLPSEAGHRWGVAAIWMAALGVLIPIIGPLMAAVLAAMGTRTARRQGAEVAGSVRVAWVLIGFSLVVGLALALVLGA